MPDLEPITREEMLWSGEDLEPKTRREMYIRHLYDETQVIPDSPITREEMFILKAGEELHDVTIEQLTATENRTYSEEGVAYSPVIVNVPQPTLTTLDVTENGTYTAPSGTAYDEVTVEVPLPDNAYLVKDIANTPASIATFTDGSALPMPKLEVAVEPQQDLHGYDAPWVGGAGKNKCDTHGYDGIAYNRDVGTEVTFTDSTIPVTVSGNKITYSVVSWGGVVFKTPSLPSGTYHFHAEFSSTVNRRTIYVLNSNNVVKEAANYSDSGGILDLNRTLEDGDCIAIWIGSNSAGDITITNMQVESGSSYTAWQPYSNICPISGWDEVNVGVSGVNVWDEEWEQGVISITTGQNVSGNGIRSKNYSNCKGNTSYYFSVGQTYDYIMWYDKDKNFINHTYADSSKVVTSPSNAYYFKIRIDSISTYSNNVSVNYPSTDTEYHAYNGSTYTIDLDGTRYGGKLDVVSGVMTVTHGYVDLPSLGWGKSTNTANIYFYVLYTSGANGTYNDPATNVMSNIYTPKSRNSLTNTQGTVGISAEANALYIADGRFNDYTVAQFKEAVSDVQLLLPLATPLTIQLTPTQVNSLLGVNNVWADCGDIIDGQYFSKEV